MRVLLSERYLVLVLRACVFRYALRDGLCATDYERFTAQREPHVAMLAEGMIEFVLFYFGCSRALGHRWDAAAASRL